MIGDGIGDALKAVGAHGLGREKVTASVMAWVRLRTPMLALESRMLLDDFLPAPHGYWSGVIST
jgi:hypothetical protein